MISAEDAQNVAPDEARSALSLILASPDFAASRHLTNFLLYIVSESLAGRSKNLKERSVAAALGRGTDFDPRLDCIVRVTAGKLRRSLECYYARQGASDAVCIVVPKGCYCPVFRRQSQAAPAFVGEASVPCVSLAVEPAAARPRIAVVRLKSMTGGGKERLLADLLADNVAVRLGRMRRLEVIDCTTMRSRSNSAADLSKLALRRHANYAFGGTVSRQGRQVRVTVRLVDGNSGVLAWGDQYDLEIGNSPLQQQDDIAGSIAAGIRRRFGSVRRARGLQDDDRKGRKAHFVAVRRGCADRRSFSTAVRRGRDDSKAD
jgi:TolB-like protein